MLNHEPLRENRKEKGGTQRNVNEEERRKGTSLIEEGRGSEEWRMKRRGKEIA